MKTNRWLYIISFGLITLTSPQTFSFSNSSNLNMDLVNSLVNRMDMNEVREDTVNLSQCIGSVSTTKPISGKCKNGVNNVKMWRLGGSPEEEEVVNYVVSAFSSFLPQGSVQTEKVPVDMWRFLGASLTVKNGNQTKSYPAASIAGSSILPTNISKLPAGCTKGTNGITCNYQFKGANLVWVNKGLASDYEKIGPLPPNSIVFYSWDDTVDWASAQCYEAKARGAIAVVQTTLPELGSFYYHEAKEGGGTFDMVGDGSSCPPMITLSPRDARDILNVLAPNVLNSKNPPAPTPLQADFNLKVQMNESTASKPNYGTNVIAKIQGREYPNEVIIFSGHHDAYYEGAADAEASIALMIGMAKAIQDAINKGDYKPKRTMLFVSVSSEEFGLFDGVYDWLNGSFRLTKAHPEWKNAFNGGEYPIAEVNVGDVVPAVTGGRIQYTVTQDLLDAANNWYSSFAKDIDPQLLTFIATYVDQFTYYKFAGIPNVGFDQWTLPYYHNFYHTDGDTVDILDMGKLKEVAKINMITAMALDNADVLPYDYDKGMKRLKDNLDLSIVTQLVSIGQSEGLPNCNLAGIDAKLNTALSEAANTNVKMQNTKSPTDKNAIKLVNQYLREASGAFSELSTSDGAITPETTYLHVPSQRDVVNMNAAIVALQSNTPSKALTSLLNITPYLNVFITNFGEKAFNQRANDYCAVLDATVPNTCKETGMVGPLGPKSFAWGEGASPAYGFYKEYHAIKGKMGQKNSNYTAEINSIKAKRNHALNFYCDALSKTLNTVNTLTDKMNDAMNAANQ